MPSAAMPSWFAVYPEFSVGAARGCVGEVESFCSTVRAVRNQILDIENMLKRDGQGAWFEEYSQQVKRLWFWLGDVHVALNMLGVGMSDAVVKAEHAQRVKEDAWASVQRYIHPVGESVVPVSASVALRDYGRFTTREYPVQVPYLESPYHTGASVNGVYGGSANVASDRGTIGVNTDSVRRASVVWRDMGQRYRRAFNSFHDAISAWTRECGVFAPANFTPLLESLNHFLSITERHVEDLSYTARRFDEADDKEISVRLLVAHTEWDPFDEENLKYLRPFDRGLLKGGKDTVESAAGIVGYMLDDMLQPSFLDKPEKEFVDGVEALFTDPLGAVQGSWESVKESCSTIDGFQECLGSVAGGTFIGGGIPGAAFKGFNILSKGAKLGRAGKGGNKFYNPTNPKPVEKPDIKISGSLNANIKDVLKIDGAKINDGYLADRGTRGNRREWYSEDPAATAEEVADKLTKGYKSKEILEHGDGTFKGYRYEMQDDTIIIYRPVSAGKSHNEVYGQGSPAIDIGKVPENSPLKNQKIHFVNTPQQ